LEDRITHLLADVLQLPAAAITDDLAMKDTEVWDSLRHMELVVSLERSFGIALCPDDIVAMQTVGQIRRVLAQRGAY
jgi:acyl carrier protein